MVGPRKLLDQMTAALRRRQTAGQSPVDALQPAPLESREQTRQRLMDPSKPENTKYIISSLFDHANPHESWTDLSNDNTNIQVRNFLVALGRKMEGVTAKLDSGLLDRLKIDWLDMPDSNWLKTVQAAVVEAVGLTDIKYLRDTYLHGLYQGYDISQEEQVACEDRLERMSMAYLCQYPDFLSEEREPIEKPARPVSRLVQPPKVAIPEGTTLTQEIINTVHVYRERLMQLGLSPTTIFQMSQAIDFLQQAEAAQSAQLEKRTIDTAITWLSMVEIPIYPQAELNADQKEEVRAIIEALSGDGKKSCMTRLSEYCNQLDELRVEGEHTAAVKNERLADGMHPQSKRLNDIIKQVEAAHEVCYELYAKLPQDYYEVLFLPVEQYQKRQDLLGPPMDMMMQATQHLRDMDNQLAGGHSDAALRQLATAQRKLLQATEHLVGICNTYGDSSVFSNDERAALSKAMASLADEPTRKSKGKAENIGENTVIYKCRELAFAIKNPPSITGPCDVIEMLIEKWQEDRNAMKPSEAPRSEFYVQQIQGSLQSLIDHAKKSLKTLKAGPVNGSDVESLQRMYWDLARHCATKMADYVPGLREYALMDNKPTESTNHIGRVHTELFGKERVGPMEGETRQLWNTLEGVYKEMQRQAALSAGIS